MIDELSRYLPAGSEICVVADDERVRSLIEPEGVSLRVVVGDTTSKTLLWSLEIAQYDHIVPAACSQPLMEMIGSTDKQEITLPGGHVSIAAGANAVKRMWPRLDAWLEGRSV